MHPRTEVIQSGKVRNLDVTESLTYQGTPFVPSAATDEKAKVSSNDTTAGYLNGKLVAGTNITLTENNNGGNETLTISAAGGGGGTTGFTPTQNVAAPNATINASRLLVDVATSSGDAVLQPKGFGAVMAQLPDSTSTGGNKRGSYAVDWQMHRATAAQVATGNYSVVLGGSSNTASQDYSVVGGRQNTVTAYSAIAAGYLNETQNTYCFIGAGQNNIASGDKSVVTGGQGNTASGALSVVGGGVTNSATGSNCTVGGGSNNVVSGTSSTIAGGVSNTVQFDYCTIGGGSNNLTQSSARYATIAGGQSNQVEQQYDTVGGGYNNRANGGRSVICGGTNNRTGPGGYNVICGGDGHDMDNQPSYSVVVGGSSNYISHSYAIAMGRQSITELHGSRVMANGVFVTRGDAQLIEAVYRRQTTTGAVTQITSNGSSPLPGENILLVNSDTAISFDILVVARNVVTNSESAGWTMRGLISNNAGTTALVGTPTVTSLGSDAGASTWSVSVTANDAQDCLSINVIGEAGKTINWVAHLRAIKVIA